MTRIQRVHKIMPLRIDGKRPLTQLSSPDVWIYRNFSFEAFLSQTSPWNGTTWSANGWLHEIGHPSCPRALHYANIQWATFESPGVPSYILGPSWPHPFPIRNRLFLIPTGSADPNCWAINVRAFSRSGSVGCEMILTHCRLGAAAPAFLLKGSAAPHRGGPECWR